MEDARVREAPAPAPAAAAAAATPLTSVPEVTMRSGPVGDLIPGAETEDEEERLLAQAIALSTQQGEDVEMGDGTLSFHLFQNEAITDISCSSRRRRGFIRGGADSSGYTDEYGIGRRRGAKIGQVVISYVYP